MIPKSGNRFSDKIMRDQKAMIPKSGNRFSDEIMREPISIIPNRRSAQRKMGTGFFGHDNA
ncbi:hypothetical protein MES4922_190098 [Mesorhizobium ventifaucium]|uniref:Uncharacterized protein n=1 Tax=Mesorhizobium ventifaucium TaxID=666020 RepID=A0ABN8JJ51_9HYPH|nr:hypothetical protein MES4922_190098 [Mesorhizobium ventifaucium]